jgi:hypothetical protein
MGDDSVVRLVMAVTLMSPLEYTSGPHRHVYNGDAKPQRSPLFAQHVARAVDEKQASSAKPTALSDWIRIAGIKI